MKNIILSPVSLKNIIIYFLAGLLGVCVFGAIFGFIGLIFANNLGFNVSFGSEEIAMDASATFYCLLSMPFGALFGVWIASKIIGYKSK